MADRNDIQAFPGDDDAWDQLMLSYLESADSVEALEKVRPLLSDARFRRRLAKHAADSAGLFELLGCLEVFDGRDAACGPGSARSIGDREIQPQASLPGADWTRRLRRARDLAIAAGLAASFIVAAVIYSRDRPGGELAVGKRPAESRAHVVEDISGLVEVAGRPAGEFTGDLLGQTIRTIGPLSSVRIVAPDQTVIQLAGDTSARVVEVEGQDHVYLDYGNAVANVSPQPQGKPLLLHTPSAELKVVGTEFAVSSVQDATKLSVSEGVVVMKPSEGSNTVSVHRGESAEARPNRVSPAFQTILAPDSWAEHFTDGLPAGWTQGEHRTDGSDKLRGGFVAASDFPSKLNASTSGLSQQQEFAIRSQVSWNRGLARVGEGTIFTYRIKMDHPDWYQVILQVRGESSDDKFDWVWNYEYQETIDWESIQPGEWRQVSVPLDRFIRTPRPRPERYEPFDKRSGESPPVGGQVAFVVFSSLFEERGMMLDDIEIRPASLKPPLD